MTRFVYATGIAIAVLSLTSALGRAWAYNAASAPDACTQADEKLWRDSSDSLGILVTDKARQIGGSVGIVKFDPNGLGVVLNPILAGYYPVSGAKETTCGTLDHWLVYLLPPLERDLHPYIKPSARFNYVLADLPLYATKDCPNGCIWGEVTAPSAFEWFWKDRSTGSLQKGDNLCAAQGSACVGKTDEFVGGAFCMYGPWIMEKAHSYHPEIHPVQIFWGQTKNGYASLYLVDDDSTRFNRADAFGAQYLSPSFKPWSGDLQATVYQILRLDSSKPSSLIWDDTKPGLRMKSIDTGAGAIEAKFPAWAEPKLTRACVAADHRTQAVLESQMSLDGTTRWRGINIAGTNTGINYTSPSTLTAKAAPGPKEEESPWETHFEMEWGERRRAARTEFLASAAAWGVADQKDWNAIARQRLVVNAFNSTSDPNGPSSVPPGLQSKWIVRVTNLDNPGVPVSSNAVTLDLDYDRNVPTQIDANVTVHRHDTSHRGEFDLLARFSTADAGAAGVLIGNYKVSVTTRVWAGTHADEQTNDLYSIVPNQLAAVSGYNLKAMKGVFPDRLARLIRPLAEGNGCTVSLSQFVDDLNGAGGGTDTIASLNDLVSARRRAAGILRQAVNIFLQDRTLTAAELGEVLRITRRYQAACASGS
jgi:hypothetical protein